MIKEAAKKRVLNKLSSPYWSPDEIIEILMQVKPETEKGGIQETMFYAARSTGTTISKMISKSRRREDVIARNLVAYHMRKQGYTYDYIGRTLKRDHAAIIHGVNKIQDDIDYNFEPVLIAFNKFKKLQYGL